MTETEVIETEGTFERTSAYRVAGAMVAGAVMIAPYAMAATINLNDTIGPLLDSVAELIPSMINLILAAVPLAVVGGLVGALLKWFPDIFTFGRS